MNSFEHTDSDGDALTITTQGAKTWITSTSGGEEVTVGPFATDAITGALPAALIEQEVEREAQPSSAAPSVGLLEAALQAALDAERTALKERDEARETVDLIDAVARDHAQTVTRLRRALDLPDNADADLMVGRIEAHQQAIEGMRAEMHACDVHNGTVVPDGAMVERARQAAKDATGVYWERSLVSRMITAAVNPEPARPDWLTAPAVRAWHKHDERTEHDGTPGKPRIWSPDYGTTETWSTPSLRHVPWTDLVDVEALGVTAEVAEGLDRAAEFMSAGMARFPEDGAA